MPVGHRVIPATIGQSLYKSAATALIYKEIIGGIQYIIAVDGTTHAIISWGIIDDITINATLIYVNALGGGLTYIEEETYTLTVSIVYPGDSLRLKGTGRATYFDGTGLAAGDIAIEAIGVNDCSLENISVETATDASHIIILTGSDDFLVSKIIIIDTGANSHGIFIQDGSDDFIINGCIIVDTGDTGDAIHIEGTNIVGGIISGNTIEDAGGTGDCINCNMDGGNTALDLIIISNRLNLTAAGNHIDLTDASGILSDNTLQGGTEASILCGACDDIILIGNTIRNVDGDGIQVIGSLDVIVSNNRITSTTNDGIHIANADRIVIVGNNIDTPGIMGIRFDNASAPTSNPLVADNKIYTAGIYGILFDFTLAPAPMSGVDEGLFIGNYILSSTNSGIYGTTSNCSFIGNYIMDSGDSGVGLTGNASIDSDENYFQGNTITDNTDYGIELVNAFVTNTFVGVNKLDGNTAGAIDDNGTGTRTPEIVVYAPNQDAYVGATPSNHRGQQCLDNVPTQVPFEIYIPSHFQELVTAHVVYVTGANGTINRSVATDFGKVCAGEQIDTHSDSIAAADIDGNTTDELECDEISAALTGLAYGDTIGMTWTNFGAAAGTIDATVWVIKVRIRYV